MIKLMSSKVACFLCKDEERKDNYELYEYAVYIILSSVFHIATIIVLGLCFNLLVESLVLYFSYIAIRKFAGGYHAKTPARCYLCSLLISIIILSAIKLFCCTNIYILTLLIVIEILCVILISRIAPLDSDNNPLNSKEKKYYRKVSRVISTALLCISIITIRLNYIKVGVSIMLVIFMSAGVLLARYVQNVINRY